MAILLVYAPNKIMAFIGAAEFTPQAMFTSAMVIAFVGCRKIVNRCHGC
jgi:hypothetical protein